MPKPPTSAERAALVAAHEASRAAHIALSEAEDAYRQALTDWSEASRDADGIEKQIARLLDRRDPGINQLRWEYAEQVDAARAALTAEEKRIEPVKAAYDAAKARIPEAERAVTEAQARVVAAARRVANAEAIPAARAGIARLERAYMILLEVGPDVLAMVDKGLLPPEIAHEAETAAGAMLRRMASCSDLVTRCRQSPWRVAVERLQNDPAAPLPTAAP
jgi:hypothetical protein